MKTKFLTFFLAILLIFSALNMFSTCGNREETVSCFPNQIISIQININLPAYNNLQTIGGWIYINEQQSGTRGLIIVRTTSGFKIYDRNAPHICPDTSTTLEVKDNIKITCPKDGAEWILLTGEPVKVSQLAPKTYHYTYDASGNLSIYN